ncbi:MAG: class I SAM-dependent methyltransferase [Pseudomonadota bacterium]
MKERNNRETELTSTGVFKKAAAMNLQELLDAQLKLQVDVSFNTHHDFLVRHGLPDCQSVLDVGTGNGYFCIKLAELYQHIKFVGVDFMEDMLQRARDEARCLNMDNVQLVAADLRTKPAIGQDEGFDAILLRYTAYHIKELKEVLKHLKGLLKSGGRIWIIDEALLIHKTDPTTITSEDLEMIRDFVENVVPSPDYYGTYGHVMIAAVK